MIARRIAPGLRRRFAFESWPDFDADVWRAVVERAESKVLARSPVLIQGSDRDAGAVDSAKANAERAGVAGDVELTKRAVSAIEPPDEPGWIVSNPPYGVRVGDADRLRNLYAQIGNTLRAKCPGWRVVLVSADASLERQLGLGTKPLLKTTNGGIGVRLIAAQVPSRPDRPAAAHQTTDTSAAQRYPS
jgi:putative N6-adenine-specific DNA methylase